MFYATNLQILYLTSNKSEILFSIKTQPETLHCQCFDVVSDSKG